MKKFISLLLIFVLLTGCSGKEKTFVPSEENINSLLEHKGIPYTVANFQHHDHSAVENVVQYSCGLANKYGENIYAMVLAYEGEICHSVTVISMQKTQGLEEAQKIAGFAMDVYGFDEKHIKGFSESIEYDIDMVNDMIEYHNFVPENNRLEINYSDIHYVFLPSADDEMDYSNEKIRLSTFSIASQEYEEKLEAVRREERRKLIVANPKLYTENAMYYPRLFDVEQLNGQLVKMGVPFTVEFRSEEQSSLGITHSYYDVYADGHPVGILYTEQFICGASVDFTYNNVESKYHEGENATEYMVKTVCAAYGVDYPQPLKAVEETGSSVESKYYAFDGFYGEFMAVGDYSVVNKMPYHFELYDAELFKALLERDKEVSPRYADAYKEFFE